METGLGAGYRGAGCAGAGRVDTSKGPVTPVESEHPASPNVHQRAGLMREAVVDADGEDRGQGRDQIGHAVGLGEEADAAGVAAALVAFGEGGGVQFLGQDRQAGAEACGAAALGGGDGEKVELRLLLGREG